MNGEIGHRIGLHTGHRLHGYGIRRVLGQSGFGITYLARDFQSDRDVVLNEFFPIELAVRGEDLSVQPLSPRHAEIFSESLGRFVNEGRALTSLTHPNLERVRSVLEANETAFVVSELEPGRSFETWLARRNRFDEGELLRLLLPLLGALEHAHGAGFLHGNIKPSNLLVRPDGGPVLVDFGAGRRALSSRLRSQTGLVSPGYVPFELYYRDEDAEGPASDLYGLAAVLYRAVTGSPPADAIDRDAALTRTGIDPYRTAVDQGRGRYSERFLRALDQALAFRPEARPAGAGEWRRALDLPARGGSADGGTPDSPDHEDPDDVTAAAPPQPPSPAVAPVHAPEPNEPRPELIPSPRRLSARRRWAVTAVLAALIAGVIIVNGRNRDGAEKANAGPPPARATNEAAAGAAAALAAPAGPAATPGAGSDMMERTAPPASPAAGATPATGEADPRGPAKPVAESRRVRPDAPPPPAAAPREKR